MKRLRLSLFSGLLLAAWLLAACSRVEIGEIHFPAEGLTAGSEVDLRLPVAASEPVRYQWTSLDGGVFNNPSIAQPRFLLPQKEKVSLRCVVTVGNRPPVTRTAELYPHLLAAVSPAAAPAASQPPTQSPSSSPAPAADTGRGPVDIFEAGFVASGWMGDGAQGNQYVTVVQSGDAGHPRAQRWQWKPGEAGWLAVAYQYPANNWGSWPGKNWSRRGLQRITFWARGARTNGRLPVVEFKAGNGTDPARRYQDSFARRLPPRPVPEQWTRIEIPLAGGAAAPADLSSVITAFLFALSKYDNPDGATFYLDQIRYE
jgi:hypothetical protein